MNTNDLTELQKYSDGTYTSAGLISAFECDAEIAEKPCEVCGEKREYEYILHSGTYRAFSVCRDCDDVIEF